MSQTSSITRKLLMIRKIQSDNKKGLYPSLGDLVNYVTDELQRREIIDVGLSNLTFKRDIKEIKKYFDIPLVYNRKLKGYEIDKDYENDSIIETILEAFEILSSLGGDGGMPDYVIPEKRKSKGTEHFTFLLSCIKNNEIVTFSYFKYDSNTTTKPIIAPYALKESRQRWYLLGIPEGKTDIRAYGLDRISTLNSIERRFKKQISIDEIIEKYVNCFAMFSSTEEAQEIILSYDQRDGNYIKSFPMHHSQKVEDKGNKVIVSLYLKIELDFIMELLSRSWSVEVIEPLTLRAEFKRIFKEASLRNSI